MRAAWRSPSGKAERRTDRRGGELDGLIDGLIGGDDECGANVAMTVTKFVTVTRASHIPPIISGPAPLVAFPAVPIKERRSAKPP